MRELERTKGERREEGWIMKGTVELTSSFRPGVSIWVLLGVEVIDILSFSFLLMKLFCLGEVDAE